MDLQANFIKIILNLYIFQRMGKKGKSLNLFYEATINLILKPDKDNTRKQNYRVILLNIEAQILNKN